MFVVLSFILLLVPTIIKPLVIAHYLLNSLLSLVLSYHICTFNSWKLSYFNLLVAALSVLGFQEMEGYVLVKTKFYKSETYAINLCLRMVFSVYSISFQLLSFCTVSLYKLYYINTDLP